MKLVSESLNEYVRGQDPREMMGIGEKVKIKAWMEKVNKLRSERFWGKDPIKYEINPDLSITTFDSFELPYEMEMEPYIKFKDIYGNFEIRMNSSLKNLDFFPKHIYGGLIFHDNNIKLNEKKFEKMDVIVDGEVRLRSYRQEAASKAGKRYRKRGPLSSRVSHRLSDLGGDPARYGPKYSKGFKLYHALKGIEEAGPEGLRYTDIVKILYELSYGKGSFKRDKPQGWGTSYFSTHYNVGGIRNRTTKKPDGKYILNDVGRKYLEEYADIFED